MQSESAQRSANKWAARAIPLLIIGASGFVVYVTVDLICVDYLLSPQSNGYTTADPRPSIAIPIIVFFFIFYLLWLICYVRLMQTIATNPGYTERRPHTSRRDTPEPKQEKGKNSLLACGSTTVVEDTYPVLNRSGILQGVVPAPPGLDYFLNKDVFVCDPQGLPLFCDVCNNWKPDRTHHCSEVDRCVRRMDHFCPWVGGIVSETNIKFFLQFLFYAATWGTYGLGFTAWALTDRIQKSNASRDIVTDDDGFRVIVRDFSQTDGRWIGCLALYAVLGVLFGGGMFLTTLYNAAVNRSTNEQVVKRSYYLAVRLPRRSKYEGPAVTYPLDGAAINPDTPRITFAIVQTRPADNIWSTSYLGNLRSVLGNSLLEWILPIKYPPCTWHEDTLSDYPLGEDFQRVCRESGVT